MGDPPGRRGIVSIAVATTDPAGLKRTPIQVVGNVGRWTRHSVGLDYAKRDPVAGAFNPLVGAA